MLAVPIAVIARLIPNHAEFSVTPPDSLPTFLSLSTILSSKSKNAQILESVASRKHMFANQSALQSWLQPWPHLCLFLEKVGNSEETSEPLFRSQKATSVFIYILCKLSTNLHYTVCVQMINDFNLTFT